MRRPTTATPERHAGFASLSPAAMPDMMRTPIQPDGTESAESQQPLGKDTAVQEARAEAASTEGASTEPARVEAPAIDAASGGEADPVAPAAPSTPPTPPAPAMVNGAAKSDAAQPAPGMPHASTTPRDYHERTAARPIPELPARPTPSTRPAERTRPVGPRPEARPALVHDAPRPHGEGDDAGLERTATAPQLRRFIKSRAYVPMHELRRRFAIIGDDDEVTPVDLEPRKRVFVGLPEHEGRLLGELLRAGDIGYELSLDPISPIVVGVYPMRPVTRP